MKSSESVCEIPKTKIIESVFTIDRTNYNSTIPYGLMFLICLFTIAALFIVFLSVRVYEVSVEIADLKEEIDAIEIQKVEAKGLVMRKRDLANIQQKAESLGMVKAERLQSHYIQVSLDDEITLYEDTSQNIPEYNFSILLSAIRQSLESLIK